MILGSIFFKSKRILALFSGILQRFSQILPEFYQIKTFGDALPPPTPLLPRTNGLAERTIVIKCVEASKYGFLNSIPRFFKKWLEIQSRRPVV